jgi:dTDP-4-dehydrorhamnose 3,5-epimerase
MEIERFDIKGLALLTPDIFRDERGYFFETWSAAKYAELGIPADAFVQDNESESIAGTVRGLHFQAPPFAQGKLVRVIVGRVIDVAVDIRFGSPTFGKSVAVELSATNKKQFWIPAGFAHGFATLEPGTIFAYKVTAPYAKECDGGILWNDPALGIPWPTTHVPIVSEKDSQLPTLAEYAKHPSFRSEEC